MATDADALPKTDESIATDKVTTVTSDTSTTSIRAVRSEDDKSVEALDFLEAEDEDIALMSPDISGFHQPLRVNLSKPGLANSFSTLEIPRNEKEVEGGGKKLRRRKSDPNSHRSGSRSPAYDGGSSISSLEELGIDTDLLTDKMGTLELDLKEQQEQTDRLNRSLSNLPPVSERLSEETLDDVHAFTDLKREEGYVSRGGSINTGGEMSSSMLEPLDEVDEEDEQDERGKVKITNMEEILEVPDEDAPDPVPSPVN